MKKILPINDQCVMNCFNFEAFLYNIMSTDDSHREWTNENYINVFMKYNWWEQEHNHIYSVIPLLENTPDIDVTKIRRDFFKEQNLDIVNVIKKSIYSNLYIYLYLDEYYLENSSWYQNQHFIHDSLITGVDSDKRLIYLYTYDKNWQLKIRPVRFQSVQNAFSTLNKMHENDSDIFFYRIKPSNYKFDICNMKANFIDYLEGKNTLYIDSTNCKPEFIYGIKIYEVLKQVYLHEGHKVDLRICQKLVEHKKILIERIKFLIEKQNLVDKSYLNDAEKIYEISKKIKVLSMKFNYTRHENKRELLDSIIQKLDQIQKIEEIFLKKLVNEI